MNSITRLFGLFTLICALVATSVCPVKGQTFTDGLVAYYPFNGNVNDASGNGNNGTANNILFASDRFGNANSAASFSGNSDSLITIDSTQLNLNAPLTVSAWVEFAGPVSGRILSTSGYELAIDGYMGAGMNVTDTGLAGAGVESGSQLPFNVWLQVVGVWTPNGGTLYIDGVPSGAYSTTLQPDYSRGFTPTIGRNSGSLYDSFPGLIDDLRVYDRALSAADVLQLYVSEVPEPSAALLTLSGLALLLARRQRKEPQ